MKSIKILAMGIFTLVMSQQVSAQVITGKTLTLEAAKKIAAEARKYAESVSAPGGSIAVVDAGGNLLFMERPEKTFAGSAMVAFEKARTAAAFRMPTKNFEDKIREGRTPLITVGYTMLEGGVPIVVDGEVVGAIGVSGAASSTQDVAIAEAGAKTKID